MPSLLKEKNETNKKLVRDIPINLSIDINSQNEINYVCWFKGSRQRGFR